MHGCEVRLDQLMPVNRIADFCTELLRNGGRGQLNHRLPPREDIGIQEEQRYGRIHGCDLEDIGRVRPRKFTMT
jgi:hypothetical protein